MITYNYYIANQLITPYGSNKSLVWEIYNEEIFGRYKLDKPIILVEQEDLELITSIRDNNPLVPYGSTDTIPFKIEQVDNGVVKVFYQGVFKIVNVDFSSIYKGRISVKITTRDKYTDILQGYSDKDNILGYDSSGIKISGRYDVTYSYVPTRAVQTQSGGNQIQSISASVRYDTDPNAYTSEGFVGTNDPYIKGLYSITNVPLYGIPLGVVTDSSRYIFVRLEYLSIPDGYLVGSDVFYDQNFNLYYESTVAEPSTRVENITFERAIKLKDVYDYFTRKYSLVEISSFLWNGQREDGSPTLFNYVTGDNPNPLLNIYIIQKSDFIARSPDEPARIGEISFSDALRVIKAYFDTAWDIDSNGLFRTEHISYYKTEVGLNLTNSEYSDSLDTRSGYKYKEEKLLNKEVYFSNEARSTDFQKGSIAYDYVLLEGEVNEMSVDSGGFTSDIHYIINKPGNISQTGFAIVQTNSSREIQSEIGNTSNIEIMNGHLCWANLIPDYHKHRKSFIDAEINGLASTMSSLKRNREQELITIHGYVEIDPMKLVTTNLGDGEVEKMVINLDKGIIQLTLLHD